MDERREKAVERVATRLGPMYGAENTATGEPFSILGSPDDCARRIDDLRAAGVEHLIVSPIAVPTEIEDQLGLLAAAAAS